MIIDCYIAAAAAAAAAIAFKTHLPRYIKTRVVGELHTPPF